MIQPVPLAGTPAPAPGPLVGVTATDLFAALLAGQIASSPELDLMNPLGEGEQEQDVSQAAVEADGQIPAAVAAQAGAPVPFISVPATGKVQEAEWLPRTPDPGQEIHHSQPSSGVPTRSLEVWVDPTQITAPGSKDLTAVIKLPATGSEESLITRFKAEPMAQTVRSIAGPENSHTLSPDIKAALANASAHMPHPELAPVEPRTTAASDTNRPTRLRTAPLRLSSLGRGPAPESPTAREHSVRRGYADHDAVDAQISDRPSERSAADQGPVRSAVSDPVGSVADAARNIEIARPAVTTTVRQEPFTLTTEHEGTPVRLVLEDWNAQAPIRSIRITLDPRDLGEVRVALQHRNGEVHARMIVDTPQAQQLMEAQATTLQQALAERGVHFATFSVALATNSAWTGLAAAGTPRLAKDTERKESNPSRRAKRDEVKTS